MVLQPEGLGNVSVKVTVERAGLSVHLAVDNAGTRDVVQASWPQLQQAFEQRGLTVQALMLDLSGGRGGSEAFQSFQQFAGQQSGGQQAAGQQSAGQQSRGDSSGAGRQATAAIGAVDEGPRPQPGAGTSARVDYRI
jgi:flagellar hook-length control protein FliK